MTMTLAMHLKVVVVLEQPFSAKITNFEKDRRSFWKFGSRRPPTRYLVLRLLLV